MKKWDYRAIKDINAYIDGNKIGDITYQTIDDPNRPCFIMNLWVDKEFRSKGIGKSLLKEAIKDLKDQGCKKIWLQSTSQAKGFYEKLNCKCVNSENLLMECEVDQ
ncbi:GNAT family N-acetyltransferase [Candidatus Dependentiae bacterium]|nr:GNAT family N-acetyltransferase [Candidatus Dependentiae bacterium]